MAGRQEAAHRQAASGLARAAGPVLDPRRASTSGQRARGGISTALAPLPLGAGWPGGAKPPPQHAPLAPTGQG